jgi:hypothetical protein
MSKPIPKETKLDRVREHLYGIGDKEFRSIDMPIQASIANILKILEDNGEIVYLRYLKGKVFRVAEIKGGKPAEPTFEIIAPFPYKPFLRGYEVVGRYCHANQ